MLHTYSKAGRLWGQKGRQAPGDSLAGQEGCTQSISRGGATGPWAPQRRPGSQDSRGHATLVLIFLLFLSRASAAGEGEAQGSGHPGHLPETALCLSPLFSLASRPPSLLLNLLLPHLAPSGVPSCSPCFLSPPWESNGPWGQSQAPQSPQRAVSLVTCPAC